ncbi:hypothetical protein [Archangium sp.]|uniref:hypothetical protein n=1 Tax=Archangium sp. TaxID=1872627 RepID=UPI0038999E16
MEDCAEGTRARIRAQGEALGFFRIAAPFLNRMVRRSITNDLENLREYLEGQGDASGALPAHGRG